MIYLKGIKICDKKTSDQQIIKFYEDFTFKDKKEFDKYRNKLELLLPGKYVFEITIEK